VPIFHLIPASNPKPREDRLSSFAEGTLTFSPKPVGCARADCFLQSVRSSPSFPTPVYLRDLDLPLSSCFCRQGYHAKGSIAGFFPLNRLFCFILIQVQEEKPWTPVLSCPPPWLFLRVFPCSYLNRRWLPVADARRGAVVHPLGLTCSPGTVTSLL